VPFPQCRSRCAVAQIPSCSSKNDVRLIQGYEKWQD
jgi:hypothetical protein